MVQTSRYFQSLVEPILYRRIFLDPDEQRRDPLKCPLLHDTLVERQDLLLHLVAYHGPLLPNRTSLERRSRGRAVRRTLAWVKSQDSIHPTFQNSLSYEERFENSKKIFSGAKNIGELHFTDWAGMWFQKLWSSFDTTKSNENIKNLVINGGAFSPHLLSILRRQSGLKHLELFGGVRDQLVGFESTDLPELVSLKTTLPDAAFIVPGRPIKSLELLYCRMAYLNPRQNPDEESLFRHLALSACDITTFTIRFQRSWHEEVVGEVLRLIARYLPNIERLCLSVWGGVPDSLVGPFFCRNSFC